MQLYSTTLFRGISSLTCCNTHTYISAYLMCDAFVIIQNVAHQRDTSENNNDFSVSRVSIVICLLHPVFFPPIQPEYYVFLFSQKKSHKWIDAVNCFLFYFRSVFKLYFIVFFLSFFFKFCFSVIWFSRVCLNHSLLTYKVCLNKHVLFVCFGLVCMSVCVVARVYHCNSVYIFLRLNW